MTLIRKALILAGLILAFSLGLTMAVRFELIETDTMMRAQGIMGGLVLVLIANLVPKTLEPLASTRCGRSATQAVQRFSGWTLVIAGLGHSLAWLVLPIDRANGVAMSLVAAGLLLVLIRVAWAYRMGTSSGPEPEGPGAS